MLFYSSNWDFTLNNYGPVWNFIVQVGLLLIFLLIGNFLRTVVPFLRKSLFPSALIGGVLLLSIDLILRAFGIYIIDRGIMQVITYHGLGIGFVAMTLKTVKTKKTIYQEY